MPSSGIERSAETHLVIDALEVAAAQGWTTQEIVDSLLLPTLPASLSPTVRSFVCDSNGIDWPAPEVYWSTGDSVTPPWVRVSLGKRDESQHIRFWHGTSLGAFCDVACSGSDVCTLRLGQLGQGLAFRKLDQQLATERHSYVSNFDTAIWYTNQKRNSVLGSSAFEVILEVVSSKDVLRSRTSRGNHPTEFLMEEVYPIHAFLWTGQAVMK